MSLTEEIISILACPKCQGDLALTGLCGDGCGLACESCRLVYPVRNGIPVLLVEDAEAFDSHPHASSLVNSGVSGASGG